MASKMFDVDICETRKQTIQVRAVNESEAHRIAQERWAQGCTSFTDTDVSDVHFSTRKLINRESPER